MIDERARNTPPLRGSSRSRAVCAKADAWGVLWFYKTKAPPTGAASDSVLSLPTPPQGGSHFISICRLRNSSPFFGGLFQQPPMMRGAIRPLRPENKTLRRRFAPGEIASPREKACNCGRAGNILRRSSAATRCSEKKARVSFRNQLQNADIIKL